MRFTLSGPRQQVVDKARWVAKECLEPRAAGYDASAGHTWESWNDLWNHGLLAISVPKDYGGLGADMLTYIMAIESLAYGCTNSTMTLHMHSIVQQVINAIATPEQKEVFYRDVVEDGRVFGSWGSEPESRGGTRAGKRTVIAPIEGGYVVNGRKHFCSMAGAAHRCMIHCAMRGYEGVDAFQLVLMPSDTPGISIEGEWNALGMRATVSPSVSFDECVVDRRCLLGGARERIEEGGYRGIRFGICCGLLGRCSAGARLHRRVLQDSSIRSGSGPDVLEYCCTAQRSRNDHGAGGRPASLVQVRRPMGEYQSCESGGSCRTGQVFRGKCRISCDLEMHPDSWRARYPQRASIGETIPGRSYGHLNAAELRQVYGACR